MPPDKIDEEVQGRQITFLRHLEKDFPVLLIPEKFIAVGMKPGGLMKLEIQGQERHGGQTVSSLEFRVKTNKSSR
jgi:hypothetical protein